MTDPTTTAAVKDSLTVRMADFYAWLDQPISGTTRRAYYSDNQLTAARDAWEAATAAEREACAKECEEWRRGCDNRTMQAEGWAADECAAAIRSRGAAR